PSAGTGTVETNLAQLAAAMLELQRGLLPALAGLIGNRTLLERFLASLHSPEIGGPDGILDCVHAYLAAERRLGRLNRGSDPHVAGVLPFPTAQRQALVTHSRAPTADNAEVARELQPFVQFLARTLASDRAKTAPRSSSTSRRAPDS